MSAHWYWLGGADLESGGTVSVIGLAIFASEAIGTTCINVCSCYSPASSTKRRDLSASMPSSTLNR